MKHSTYIAKKILSVLLAITMIVGSSLHCLAQPAYASIDDAELLEATSVFQFGSVAGNIGDTVMVPIEFVNSNTIDSIGLHDFTYDTNVLEFVGFDDTSLTIPNAIFKFYDEEKMAINLGWIPVDEYSGIIGNIIFKIKENAQPGSYSVSATSIVKAGFTEFESTVNEGYVTVNEGYATLSDSELIIPGDCLLDNHPDIITTPAVAATCTTTGLTEGSYCARCDEVLVAQQEVAALGHNVVTDAAVAPTCTETGLTEGSHCDRCDVVIVAQQEVAALGHVVVTDAAVEPTCTETGLTEGSHCDRCGTVIVAQQVVEALGHDYDDGVVTDEPTCDGTGVKTYTCNRCGHTYTESVDALGHVVVKDEAVEPTCTETGLTEGSHCSRCNTVIVAQQEVAALGHDYDDGVVTDEPTCDGTGVKTYTCSRCGHTYKETVDALGHVVVKDEAVAPTCTETGLTEGSHCDRCEVVIVAQQEVAALGHDYDDGVVTDEPTCDGAGVKTYTCSRCGHTYTESVDALGHVVVKDEAVEPTCTETGLTEGSHCDRCGTVIVAQQEVAALGHVEVTDAAVAPTCTKTGLTEGSHCDRCGTVIVAQQVVEKLAHTPSDWIIDRQPTETQEGSKHTECTVCKTVLETQTIAKLPSTSSTVIYPVDVKAKPGVNFDITVKIENNPGVAELKIRVGYDANIMTLVSYTASSDVFVTGPTINDAKNPIVYVVCDPTNATNDGELITFTFKTEKVCPDGDYPITIEIAEANNQDYNDVNIKGENGVVTIKAIEPGDVDANETINGRDLLFLTQYIAEMDVVIDEDGADANADGVIDGKDLLLLTQYIAELDVTLGKQ